MSDSPAELLDDLRQLRRKVRQDRHGHAFPLLLFAGLILVAPVLYGSDPWPTMSPDGRHVLIERGPFEVFERPWVRWGGSNVLIQWYWMLGLVTCFAASAWWYRRRADVAGIETDTRGYLTVAGAALVGMVFGERLLSHIVSATLDTSLYSRPEINLPIMIGAVALSGTAIFAGTRWRRLRVIGVFAAALSAMVAFATIAVYMINGLAGLLIIAVALLALAWAERSLLIAVTGVLFTAVSLHANLQGVGLLVGSSDTRLIALMDVAPPAAVLIIGGVIALVQSRRAA
ncbi:hypothetical protein KIPE111705_19475 [Kibdelosporangium persicum]|uniref:Uncharacterized protein n=1 Tax=Kibdelosporangium persicum TaxID=2698649 RepID=A0ABX2EY77_9PSEU|nr:hypothetical protein [Kibdelosporangium persicum]NRN63662.1 hypothetical protein [Kibdelosporangium persicum]